MVAFEARERTGAIAGHKPEGIDLKARVTDRPQAKNGTARNITLSSRAVECLKDMDCDFRLPADQISALFRKIKGRTLIENLTFHDTRHEAITRLSKKLDVLDLARMVGTRDLKILMVYYNATASEIAERLD